MSPEQELAEIKEKLRKLLNHVGNPGQCRKCPAQVYWVTSKNGRPSPVNADGTSHFANCPGARQVKLEQQQRQINQQRARDYGRG